MASGTPQLVDLESPSAEPFRTLRLVIDSSRTEPSPGPAPSKDNAVLFTSAVEGDGKSLVAANYALVAAYGGHRVLLLDADLRRPSVHRTFQVARAPGLSEALTGKAELKSVAFRVPGAPSLYIVPAGTPLRRSSDFLESPSMRRVLGRLREAFDLVVIDSPPVLGLADAATVASHPGVKVVLVTDARGRRRQLREAFRTLEDMGATVLGAVVNRAGALTPYEYGT